MLQIFSSFLSLFLACYFSSFLVYFVLFLCKFLVRTGTNATLEEISILTY